MDIQIMPHHLASEITRVAISGRIDSYTVERVSDELQSLIRIGSCRVVCNLRGVEFIAGGGLKAFQKLIEQARAQDGGDVKLCAIQPAVAKVVELAGFAQITQLYDSEEHALQAFGVAGIVLPSDATQKPGTSDAFGHTVMLNRKDESVRFAETQATCVLPSPLLNPATSDQAAACGQTQILPRMSVTAPPSPARPRPSQVPGFEPLRMWIPCDESYCPCIRQAVDMLNNLMRGSPSRGERLGTALMDVIRAAVSACPAESVLGVELSWKGRLPSARVVVPKADFSLYDHLRPASADVPPSPEGAERWLRNYLGHALVERGAGEVHITLAPLDMEEPGS